MFLVIILDSTQWTLNLFSLMVTASAWHLWCDFYLPLFAWMSFRLTISQTIKTDNALRTLFWLQPSCHLPAPMLSHLPPTTPWTGLFLRLYQITPASICVRTYSLPACSSLPGAISRLSSLCQLWPLFLRYSHCWVIYYPRVSGMKI